MGEAVSRWFDDNIRRVVGGDRNTLFWHDNWVGEIPLRIKFPRLFDLLSVRSVQWRLGWEDGGTGWVWRLTLLAWEEESVRECSVLFHNIVL